jgi:hypothetical protein
MTKKKQWCPRGHDTLVFGRDAGHWCSECRREDAEARLAREAAAAAERRAAFDARRAEWKRQHERERQRNLKAGGDAAIYQRWEDAYAVRGDLCQWEDFDPDDHRPREFPHRRQCFRRAHDVYCAVHNRQLERKTRK